MMRTSFFLLKKMGGSQREITAHLVDCFLGNAPKQKGSFAKEVGITLLDTTK